MYNKILSYKLGFLNASPLLTSCLAIIAGVIVVVGVVIAVATVGIICYRKHKRRDSKGTSE